MRSPCLRWVGCKTTHERGPMKKRATRGQTTRPEVNEEAAAVAWELQRHLSPEVVDELREGTGYNPRQRVATAFRVMLTVVEAFLVGQTLSFATLRAIFVRRFGAVRSCPFQKRFKQASAAAIFKAALERLVASVVEGLLVGQTRSFATLRAIFVRRFGAVRSCPFQKRFKQASAAAFFKAALERLVASVVESAGLQLRGPLAKFADVRLYDGTVQR